VKIHGEVQGVFFRETVRRIAAGYEVHGFVRNVGYDGVEIDVEGKPEMVEAFLEDVLAHPPSAARIERIHSTTQEPAGRSGFSVVSSKRDEA
jgi:hydrogenase maturation factor HypF (carbamoyltransferase family)